MSQAARWAPGNPRRRASEIAMARGQSRFLLVPRHSGGEMVPIQRRRLAPRPPIWPIRPSAEGWPGLAAVLRFTGDSSDWITNFCVNNSTEWAPCRSWYPPSLSFFSSARWSCPAFILCRPSACMWLRCSARSRSRRWRRGCMWSSRRVLSQWRAPSCQPMWSRKRSVFRSRAAITSSSNCPPQFSFRSRMPESSP